MIDPRRPPPPREADPAAWVDNRPSRLRWLLTGLLVVCGLILVLLCVPGLDPDPLRWQYAGLVLACAGVLAAADQLNRRHRYRLASWLTVWLALLGTWAAILIDGAGLAQNVAPLFYPAYAMVLAAFFLDSRGVALTAGLQLAAVAGLAVGWRGAPPAGLNLFSLFFFHAFAAALSVLANAVAHRHSQRLARQTLALSESEQRFRKVFEASGVGMAMLALDHRFVAVNPALCAIVGYSAAELKTRASEDLTHPDDRAASQAWWEKLKDRELAPHQLKKRYRHQTGRVVWINLTGSVIRDAAGQPLYFLAMMEDITAREAAETALQAANRQLTDGLAVVQQRARELALLQTLSGQLQGCTTLPEAYALFERIAAELLPGGAGALYVSSQPGEALQPVAAWNDAPAHGAVAVTDCPALANLAGGVRRWPGEQPPCSLLGAADQRACLCLPFLNQASGAGVVQMAWPAAAPAAVDPGEWAVSERLAQTATDSLGLAVRNLRLNETLREQSVRDPLTGLFNRRYLAATVERELRRAERDSHPVGIILLDLDQFKQFNDRFGHPAGDAALQRVGEFLRQGMRAGDIASRYGGEEFCLMLPEASLADTLRRAESLRVGLRHLVIPSAGRDLGQLTASFGVAAYPEHGLDWETVLASADRGLYQAKQQGRDCVCVAAALAAAKA